ncbi:uncharacterized protein EI97DRAFT_429036 [Westerdykella ornata]|uniref:INSIG domain-containing protein n=1 Tax=Westerdykella ornata TaxID=318751 RepID=A0A6A6JXM6_WESOR|nr:uncharacterized protein EI97DRAFT_429036 [Westerdykella ornata]KAF2280944.1 hypothetical protein EI97DRAFT_429036 [Westerdykella ornata]
MVRAENTQGTQEETWVELPPRNRDGTAERDEDPFVAADTAPHHNQQSPPHIHRPVPRRNFSILSQTSESLDQFPPSSPPSTSHIPNTRSSDFLAQLTARLQPLKSGRNDGASENGSAGGLQDRSKSFLNMKSTLFGIFDEAGTSIPGESTLDTPLDLGALTPSLGAAYDNGPGSPDGGVTLNQAKRRPHNALQRQHSGVARGPKSQKNSVGRLTNVVFKLVLLFLFGAAYGITVSHLHDRKELAAVNVGGVDFKSWTYWTAWGLAGVVLGTLLPYVDLISSQAQEERRSQASTPKESEPSTGEQWNEIVRSIGAFVGIAFAIRRLPWESTLQLIITLALVNPALWYILDRTRNGVLFSLTSTSLITSFIFLANPDILPSPEPLVAVNATQLASAVTGRSDPKQRFAGVISYDNVATATWVGSVIFCSCICFGGIGRRLAVFG